MTKTVHAAGVLFQNEQGQILVLKRHARDPEGGTWGLPGGKLEKGEAGGAAVIREVEEEIGHVVAAEQLRYIKTYHWRRKELEITFEVFLAEVRREDVKIDINAVEHTEHHWAAPGDLYARPDLMAGLYPILAETYQFK